MPPSARRRRTPPPPRRCASSPARKPPARAAKPPIVVAFSGGGDSVALLRRARSAGDPTVAAIVDHALQPQSAAMAAAAVALAEASGATPVLHRLSWPAGATPGQAAARRARYRALARIARAQGASAVLAGHTADDQYETLLLRLGRGSGWRGLAGMAAAAPLPLWSEGFGLTLARPLLAVRRAALRAELAAAKAEWLEDPANLDTRFARVRVRARLARLEAAGWPLQRLAELQAAAAARAAWEDGAARQALVAAEIDAGGRVALPCAAIAAESPSVGRRMLAALLLAASGGERAAEEPALERLRQAAGAGAASGSLAGAAWRVDRGLLRVRRDPGALLGRAGAASAPAEALDEAWLYWDGRFALKGLAPGLIVRAAGHGADPAAPAIVFSGRQVSLAEAAAEGLVLAESLARHRLEAVLWRGARGEPAPHGVFFKEPYS